MLQLGIDDSAFRIQMYSFSALEQFPKWKGTFLPHELTALLPTRRQQTAPSGPHSLGSGRCSWAPIDVLLASEGRPHKGVAAAAEIPLAFTASSSWKREEYLFAVGARRSLHPSQVANVIRKSKIKLIIISLPLRAKDCFVNQSSDLVCQFGCAEFSSRARSLILLFLDAHIQAGSRERLGGEFILGMKEGRTTSLWQTLPYYKNLVSISFQILPDSWKRD